MQILSNIAVSPGTRVKLVNTRFGNVVKGKYIPYGTSLTLLNGRIVALPDFMGEPDVFPADIVIVWNLYTNQN